MSNGARVRRWLVPTAALATMGVLAACSGGGTASPTGSESGSAAAENVALEFQQWWEPELPDGALRGMMDDFEAANPGITVELLSGPYATTKEQVVAGAATGTMADVVGLDGAWVYDFAKQGSIANLTDAMSTAGYDDSQLASQVQVDGATYMIPVVNFVYPLFTNDDILASAGVTAPPTNRTEFADAASKISQLGDGTAGWALNLSVETPSGIQNGFMSWLWSSGGTMLKDGQPDVINDDVRTLTEFVKGMWDDGAISAGAFNMKEQDMVEEFTNARVGMMVDSLAHVNMIRENNPDLNFSISPIPAVDGFTGERGIPYASWGIGLSSNTEHPAEALKLIEFLMSKDVNSSLATVANAFPGNSESTPDFSQSDPLFQKAFDIYKAGYPANEFTGLPVAEELMREFSENLQMALAGQQTVDEALQKSQDAWMTHF